MDKPVKYPVMVRKADLVLVTKTDLLPHLPTVRLEAIGEALARVMPRPTFLPISASTGEGMQAWVDWLADLPERQRALDLAGAVPSATPNPGWQGIGGA